MAFKLRSGNKSSFKSMGSSPAKQSQPWHKEQVEAENRLAEEMREREERERIERIEQTTNRPVDRIERRERNEIKAEPHRPKPGDSNMEVGPHKTNQRQELELKEKSPTKQKYDLSKSTVVDNRSQEVIDKEKEKIKKEEEAKRKDQERIDQQIKGTYVETEEDVKKRKMDMIEYAPRKKPPTKQIELALLRKRKGLGPREIQGEDDQSYEAAVTRKEMGMTKEYPYYYKINGQKVSKDAYIKYKNKPGGDESGKQTNDPDVYGRKANNHGRGKKTK